MILCSCNIITEDKIKEFLNGKKRQPSVGTILKEIGCSQVCGTCSNSIVSIVRDHYGSIEISTDDLISDFIKKNGKYCHL